MTHPILTLLLEPTGALLFFLVIFIVCQAALLIAFGQRRRGPGERTAGRYTLAALGILVAWLALLVGAGATLIMSLPQNAVLPPLERAAISAVTLLIGWGFATADSPVNERPINSSFLLLGVGIVLGFMITLARWYPAPAPDGFNASSLGLAWTVIPLMTAGIGIVVVVLRFRMMIDAPLKLMFFVILAAGCAYSLIQIGSGAKGDDLGTLRLALLAAIPLWPTIIYRFVVRRLSRMADEAGQQARFVPLPPIDTSVLIEGRESLAVLKALGDMIEREAPEDIPMQIVKGVVNALKADVAALVAIDDAEYADVIAAWDNVMERPIAALALKIDEQPSLVGALMSRDQRALRTDRNLNELVDLYTRLDIQKTGPAYYQALIKDGQPVAAVVVAFPYTGRELRDSEQNLLTALAPIAARLFTISRSAIRAQDNAGLRALESAMQGSPTELPPARFELQATMDASRKQIGDLNNRVRELQIELDYERTRIMQLGDGDESITQRMRALSNERAQLAVEREALLTAIQDAQTRLIVETREDSTELYDAMVETLQRERDDLQTQKTQLETQLDDLRKRGLNMPPPAVIRKLLTNLTEDKARLEVERGQLAGQLGEINAELKALGIESTGGLVQMLAQLTEERAHYRIVAERALQDRETLIDERTRLNGQIAAEAEREAKFESMEKAIRRLAADREALLTQRDQFRQALGGQQTQIDRWQQDRARFVAELESLQADLQDAVFDRTQIQTQLTRAIEARAALEKDRDRLSAERTALQTELDQLAAAADGSRDVLQRLGANGVGQLKTMIDELTEERSDLEHKVLRAQSQIDGLKDALQKAKTRLDRSIPVPDSATVDASQAEVMLSIAQELRTPMSSIVGYVDLMLGESVGILGALQRQFLQRVKANADRLNNLVDDFIKVTALDTGQLQLQTARVDVIEIIDDAITATRTQFREKGITLKIDLPDSIPAVQGDADALQQVMMQLLSNAYLASPTDGDVAISALQVVDFVPPKAPGKTDNDLKALSGVLIAVRDQGGGIAPDDQVRVFSRLYRADNPLIQGLGDTGVGLSIARALIDMHGGRIWLETQAGVGSTFRLILPLEQADPLTSPDDARQTEQKGVDLNHA